MEFFIQTTGLVGLLILGCDQINTKTTSIPNQALATYEDTMQIKNLVRNVYKWHDIDSSKNDMVYLTDAKDSIYTGVDLAKEKIRLDELRRTNFFSEEFINNEYKIAETIGKKLRNKEFGDEWLVGDLPPFDSDANVWCNSQDYPYENSWDKIEIKFISCDDKNSTITWTWGDSEWSKYFAYKIRRAKIDGAWKISYLAGFDFDKFTGKNY